MSEKRDPGIHVPRERVPSSDLVWRRMDHPDNLAVINGVLLFDEPLDPERLETVLEQRLLIIPRFRQRMTREGRRGHWEPDPDFDLEHHLRWEELPDPGDEESLRRRVGELMSQPLDADRPLWVFHVFDNFHRDRGPGEGGGAGDGGGSAILARLHHCIGDGLALMMVLLSLTDLEPDVAVGEEARRDNPLAALYHRAERAVEQMKERAEEELQEARDRLQQARDRVAEVLPEALKLLLKPSEVLRSTSAWLKGLGSVQALGRLTFQPPDVRTPLKGPLGAEKRVAWSRGVAVEEVELLRRCFGGTLNDVLITAIAGGLRRYLEHRGKNPEGLDFRALVPVSIRTLEEMANLGNRFGLVLLTLPVGIADPVERLSTLRRRFRRLHRSMEPLVAFKILTAMGASPSSVQRLVMRFFTAKATAVMTSVPGPKQEIYLAGRELRGMMFWVPHPGALGLGLSIFTYAGTVRLGVAVDAGLVPDPERIVEGFHRELEAMKAQAIRERLPAQAGTA